MPGVEEKDIQITLDNDVLMVRGEAPRNREGESFHRVERSCSSFQRALNRLTTPAEFDQASFKNGVLTVTIDKREVSAPEAGRSIPISLADVARSFVTKPGTRRGVAVRDASSPQP